MSTPFSYNQHVQRVDYYSSSENPKFIQCIEADLKVAFYGTRGSIPVAESDYVRFGGNTPCILITFKSGRIGILDAGTGIRKLGLDFAARSIEQYDNIFVVLSHTHWDHIQGFPFFKPAYDPRRHFTLSIYQQGRIENNLENVFALRCSVIIFLYRWTKWEPL